MATLIIMDYHARESSGEKREEEGAGYVSGARAPSLHRRDVTGAPDHSGKPPAEELAQTGRRER